MEQAEACVPHFARTGLAGGLTAFPQNVEALRPPWFLRDVSMHPLSWVIGQEMPISLADMIPVIRGWLRVAEQEGMPIQFETHRNCITNDLYTTVQLLDAIPEMRLAADLHTMWLIVRCPAHRPSHWPHWSPRCSIAPTPSKAGSLPAARFRCIGFSPECQVGGSVSRLVETGPHRLACPQRRRELVSGISLRTGAPDYAITDARGRELSDRWA